jgi:hypothetical protein
MKGSKPFPLVGVVLSLSTLLLMMTACGGKTPANGPSPLNILNTSPLPTGAEGDSYAQTLQATGGLQPYVWTLDSGALPPGFTFSSGGVFSGTPPTGSAGSYSFTVRVTDSQSPTKAYQTGTFGVTINPPLTFPTSTLSPGVVAVAYSAAVAASGGIPCSTTGTPPPYNYAIAPGSGPLPPGLTLNADGTITGTPTGPSGIYPFTIQATDCFPTTATANFSITITGKIQGNYAFSFNGFNQQGHAFFMAGSFVADGGGNITSGVFDRNGNDSIGVLTGVPITPGTGANGQCPIPSAATGSVYCVGRSQDTNGSNLGTIVIASPLGSYSFSVSVSLVGDSRIILADPNNTGIWGSGVLKLQGQQGISGISLASGNFAFGLSGIDAAGSRYAGAGYFLTDANGNIASGSGLADINDNGTLQSQATLTGSVSSVDPTTGRATATFTIGSTTLDYALYVVPGKPFATLVGVQTDAGAAVTLASVTQRGTAAGGGFTTKSLNATVGGTPNGVVFELDAVSNSGGTPAPDISVGVGNFDGNGNITAYAYDENNGGVFTTPSQNSYTGTYSVGTISGRVAVSLNGVTNNPVWYLTTFNTGYVVGTDANVTAGILEPQNVSTVTIVSLFGNFYGGTVSPVLPGVLNEVETTIATPPPPPGAGNGTYVITYDTSGSSGLQMDQVLNGQFCVADNSSLLACPTNVTQNTNGRMLVLAPDSNGNLQTVDVLYLVTAGATGITGTTVKDVLLNTGASPSLTAVTH